MGNTAQSNPIQSNPTQSITSPVETLDHQLADQSTDQSAETNFADSARSPHQPIIIAGTSKGLLFLQDKQQIELEGKSVTALATASDGVWAIVDRRSVWHRPLTKQWQQIASVDSYQLNCILPLAATVLLGTSEAHLLRLTDGKIERIEQFEAVQGREEWYTPWGGPADVRSMAVGQSGELYVNVHVGGILRSLDQGQSWQPTIDFHADVHEVRTVPDHPNLVLAATAEGLAISRDQGQSWSFDRQNLHAAYARAIGICGETILLTASLGPQGGKSTIYRRPLDQTGAFKKCTQGLSEWFSDNINTGTLATLGNLAVFGTRDGQIFRSDDAGLTWQQIAANLAPIACLHLLV